MKTTLTVAIAIAAIFIYSCDKEESISEPVPSVTELETIVKGQSVTLMEAVEAFAGENGGAYPASVDSDTSLSGRVLIDLLPAGERFVNPFTGLRDQPLDGPPSGPGQLGYWKEYEYANFYSIEGYGSEGTIVEHDNAGEIESCVVESCLRLQQAVQMWREDNEGSYPRNSNDENVLGRTLLDYLPGGTLMTNCFTSLGTEPIDCMAANPGEIGYISLFDGPVPAGYQISGVGVVSGDIIIVLTNY